MKPMKTVKALLLLLFACLACARPADEEPAPYTSISGADLVLLLEAHDPPLLLDVRTAEEFEASHIPTAINISHELFPARMTELDRYKDEQIVIYCRSGRRARLVQKRMADAGFAKLALLPGDMIEWTQKGYPLAGSQAPGGE
jgi:rhodanese-related sulfurtransferase